MAGRSPDMNAQRRLAEALYAFYDACEDVNTITQLAKELNYSRGPVDRVLNGKQVPDVQLLVKIVERLGGDQRKIDEFKALRTQVYMQAPARTSLDAAVLPVRTKRESLAVEYYDSTTEFYSALTERLTTAEREICVTYIRERPPNMYVDKAAQGYFEELLKWSAVGNRRLLRVIGIPILGTRPSSEFTDWLKAHHVATDKNRSYEAKVVPWSVEADNINMALIDGRTTFITFSGISTQEISGLRADSAEFMRRWRGFFNRLWSSGKRLNTYIEDSAQ